MQSVRGAFDVILDKAAISKLCSCVASLLYVEDTRFVQGIFYSFWRPLMYTLTDKA